MSILRFLSASLFAVTSPLLRADLLVSDDFSNPATFISVINSSGTNPSCSAAPVGTIDTYRGERSPALEMQVDFPARLRGASAALATANYPLSNKESLLERLSLGFDLLVTALQPVQVRVMSLNESGAATGKLVTTVYPPVAGAYFRHSLDLHTFTAEGNGAFDPLAPAVRFEFTVRAADLPAGVTKQTLRLDNLSLASPAYYVSPNGDDTADGRTPKTAFATPNRATRLARPGDVIMLLEGDYVADDREPIATLSRGGKPAAWVVFRAYPGQRATLTTNGWATVTLDTPISYVEIRGLNIQGLARTLSREDALANGVPTKPDGTPNLPDPLYNTNGLHFDSRKGEEAGGKNHHIRYVDNTVRDVPGGGLSAIAGDHVTVLGNRVYDNSHHMRYAGSGISLFRAWDFDTDTGYKNFVLQNISAGNRCYVPWPVVGKISDGNGIIIDDFWNYQKGASNIIYGGRTLIQNNLTFGNGGSGIHAFAANHVDIVHNTAYHNSLSPELAWRQIFAGGRTEDVRVVNNILHAPAGEPVNFNLMKRSANVLYAHNLYHGDGNNGTGDGGGLSGDANSQPAEQRGNIAGLAGFVNASLDPAVADFRPGPDSPAISAGDPAAPGVPLVDLAGRPRPTDRPPTLGALEP